LPAVSSDSLLPPNSTPLEVALARLGLRLEDIDLPIAQLWDPWTCPIAALPWLAWSLSVDKWDADWSEDQKRTVTAQAIEDQRRKGSVTAVKTALARIDSLLTLEEWHQASPRRTRTLSRCACPRSAPMAWRAARAFRQRPRRRSLPMSRGYPRRAAISTW
jgi:phage tail P2-like protein